ncbi:hypothetical protein GCM10027290_14090 [Micromonospora sonneratiae]|uniref:ABC-2 type transport system permease protein n=1 Tax=Micromonospora sonneratiae TaxID=1184706 RepID=A0ABW3YLA8_9ACTN
METPPEIAPQPNPKPKPKAKTGTTEEQKYLEALAADYQSLRGTFDRLDQTSTGLLAVAVTLTAAFGAFLLDSCNLPSFTCTPRTWAPLYAFLPLAPFATMLLFADMGNAKTLRMYYTRAVEAELMRVTNAPSISFAEGYPIRLPAYGHLSVGLFGQRRGRPRYRLTLLLLYVSVASLYAFTTGLSLWIARPIDLQITMLFVYAFITAVIIRITWLGSFGSRTLWKDATMPFSWAVHDTEQLPGARTTPTRITRSIRAYLFVPRPHELLVRFWIVPFSWLLAALLSDSLGGRQLVTALVVAAVFEFVVYQGRYVANDLRGIGIDDEYSSYKRRNRFPWPVKPSWVRWAILSIVVRVGLAVWISLRILPSGPDRILLVAIAALAVQATIYEALRERVSVSTGTPTTLLSPGKLAIYLVVGLGYALRAWIGFALGGLGQFGALAIVLPVLAMLAFGVMSVTMAWALSVSTQVVPTTDRVPSDRCSRTLLKMTHLGPLGVQARLIAPGEIEYVNHMALDPGQQESLRHQRFLEPVAGMTIWNIASLITTACALGTVAVVAPEGHASLLGLALLLGTTIQYAVVRSYGSGAADSARTSRRRLSAPLVAVTGAVSTGLIFGILSSTETGVSAGLALALASFGYLYFRHACVADMEVTLSDVVRPLGRAVQNLTRRVVELIFGRYAAQLVWNRESGDRTDRDDVPA